MVGRRYVADDSKEKLHSATPESVFPLPLTPIEKYFLWDDRPEQPLTSFFHLSFESPLDTGILVSCIAKVLQHNPLLRANVTGDDNDLKWVLSDKPFRLLNLDDERPIVDGKLRPIDLRTEVGCRFWYESTAQCSRIMAQLHHSACDGVAFRAVCIDILHLYARATGNGGEATQDHALFYDRFQYAQLHDRYKFKHLGKPKRATSTWQRIKNAWYFHFQPPAPLAKSLSNQLSRIPSVEKNSPLCNLLLDRDFSQRIFRASQSRECAINDVAIAILFHTCYQWNRRHGDFKKKGRVRILMPYDLRRRTDLQMPATNRLSLSFLGRDYSQCASVDGLITSVRNELKEIRETQLYLDLLKAIELGCKWPRLMKWALRQHNSMATVAITYTGDLSRGMGKLFPEVNELLTVGNAALCSTMGAPPPRRNTNVSMAICINWGRICISAMGWQQWCEAEESRANVYPEPATVSQHQIGSQ
jgi:hypothetical protein